MACIAKHINPQILYGRDPLLPLNKLLQPKVRYLGNDENILSLEALKNIYQLVVTSLKLAHEKRQPNLYINPKFKEGDLILVKDRTAKAFQPRFNGNYRVVSQKNNQVEIRPAEGGKTTKFHVTDIKKVLPVDQAIDQLPDYNRLGHLIKLRLNPTNIPDLDWQSMVMTEVIAKTAKLKID